MGQMPGLPPLASPSLSPESSELLPFRPCSEPLLAPIPRHRGRGVVLGVRPPCMVLPELSRDSLGGKESGQGRSVRPQLSRRPAGTLGSAETGQGFPRNSGWACVDGVLHQPGLTSGPCANVLEAGTPVFWAQETSERLKTDRT
ncbi:unnamed protein product [Rangifer tarandus platyrhynchus]|uniref:Uncharacterized protein n=1 Tax=Rangifer tarandus platyrhynchus TaxID=3082113 RepID=A0ABN8YKU9_RANTA|nr:unnamed protein product [Rangifer tarandus platyrhynchus]